MKFMILVKSNPDFEARLASMEAFNEALRKAGTL